MKIVIIGRKNFIIGFQAAGFPDVYAINSQEEFNKKIEEFLSNNVGIVVCEDSFFSSLPVRLKKEIDRRAIPVFVPINPKGEKVVGESIDALMKRALGFELKR
jgi:vacuolar-type H+-ATPase subunit F/Vma7